MIEAFHTEGNCLFWNQVQSKSGDLWKEKSTLRIPGSHLSIKLPDRTRPDQTGEGIRYFSTAGETISRHYEQVIEQYESSLDLIRVLLLQWLTILHHYFNESVEDIALRYKISSRTLQRYFESATGVSTKKHYRYFVFVKLCNISFHRQTIFISVIITTTITVIFTNTSPSFCKERVEAPATTSSFIKSLKWRRPVRIPARNQHEK